MMYEDIPNSEIIAGIAVRSILTPYRLRMAAGERIKQQADRIDELEAEVSMLRKRLVTQCLKL